MMINVATVVTGLIWRIMEETGREGDHSTNIWKTHHN
jgi:hypothetical protein